MRSHTIWLWQVEGWQTPTPSQPNAACCRVQIFWAPNSAESPKAGIHPQGFLHPMLSHRFLPRATEPITIATLKRFIQRSIGFGYGVVVGSSWIRWQRFTVIQGVTQRRRITKEDKKQVLYELVLFQHCIFILSFLWFSTLHLFPAMLAFLLAPLDKSFPVAPSPYVKDRIGALQHWPAYAICHVFVAIDCLMGWRMRCRCPWSWLWGVSCRGLVWNDGIWSLTSTLCL